MENMTYFGKIVEVVDGGIAKVWRWKSLDNINIPDKEKEELIRILGSKKCHISSR